MAKVALVYYYAVFILTAVINADSQFSIYKTPESIRANGYPAERHTVVTKDGYILELHRIPGRTSYEGRPIVFLMHGLLAASNYFVALGPEHGVAYNYADAGFDVWMGNARGTKNSRNHTTLNLHNDQDRQKFFDFSFEEIGIYDVAASVDYILDITGENQLHYIGHSQGGTAFLVLASMKPEYNAKFKTVHLMAPAGFQKHNPNYFLVNLSRYTDIIYIFAVNSGAFELYPPKIMGSNNTGDFFGLCARYTELDKICDLMNLQVILTMRTSDEFSRSESGGGSIKQLAHYGQNIRDQSFRRWNYGMMLNLFNYGMLNPPKYDLTLITANVTMHYALADNMVSERDILEMKKHIVNAKVRKVPSEDFSHTDFVMRTDAKKLVTEFIIEDIINSTL